MLASRNPDEINDRVTRPPCDMRSTAWYQAASAVGTSGFDDVVGNLFLVDSGRSQPEQRIQERRTFGPDRHPHSVPLDDNPAGSGPAGSDTVSQRQQQRYGQG